MPAMPNTLPRRAVDGCDSPFSARMKHTDATRYHSATWLALIAGSVLCGRLRGRLLALEHLEHALRDEEAAERIDRCEHDGGDAHPPTPVERGGPRREHRADEHDGRDRVGDRHERRVQR